MSTNNQIQITKAGFESLKKEFGELTNVKRPKLLERLSHARSQGDLAENSDYINAKEDLEFLDGRIAELEQVLRNAVIIRKSKNGKVGVGTKVTVKANSTKHVYHIVGEWESDPTEKKISHTSPLGAALVGKKVGETVEVKAPAGSLTYKILAIK